MNRALIRPPSPPAGEGRGEGAKLVLPPPLNPLPPGKGIKTAVQRPRALFALILAVFTLTACATAGDRAQNTSKPAGDVEVGEPSYGPLPPEFNLSRPQSAKRLIKSPPPEKVTVTLPDSKPVAAPRLSFNLGGVTIDQAIGLLREVTGRNFLVRAGAAERRSVPLFMEETDWLGALKTIVQANGLVAAAGGEDIFAEPGVEPAIGAGDVIVITTYDDLIEEQEMRKKTAANTVELVKRRRKAAEERYYTALLAESGDSLTQSYRFRYADPAEAVEYLKKLFAPPPVDDAARGKAQAARTGDDGGEDAEGAREEVAGGPVRFAVFRAENLVTITAPAAKMPLIMERIREIDTRPSQVYIEARIVEIQRSHVRDLGIQWGGHATRTTGFVFPNTAGVYGAGQGPAGDPYGVSLPPPGAVDPVTGELIQDAAGAVVGVTLGDASGAALVHARLYALERQGVSRTLSNPKVMTINGEKAIIKSGREIPYQSSSANTGVTVRFKEAVISLEVTPQIMEDDRIRLRIEAKKNEVDRDLSVQGTPAIKKKELITSVAVGDGGSAVLGGLFSGEDGGYQDRVPWFHSIPGLGWLFKSDRKVGNELELLVFITPSIIGDKGR